MHDPPRCAGTALPPTLGLGCKALLSLSTCLWRGEASARLEFLSPPFNPCEKEQPGRKTKESAGRARGLGEGESRGAGSPWAQPCVCPNVGVQDWGEGEESRCFGTCKVPWVGTAGGSPGCTPTMGGISWTRGLAREGTGKGRRSGRWCPLCPARQRSWLQMYSRQLQMCPPPWAQQGLS